MVQEQLPHKRRHTGAYEPKKAKGKTTGPKTPAVKKDANKPDPKGGKDKTIEEAKAAPETPTEPNT